VPALQRASRSPHNTMCLIKASRSRLLTELAIQVIWHEVQSDFLSNLSNECLLALFGFHALSGGDVV